MAIYAFWQAAKMHNPSPWYGNITEASTSRISLSDSVGNSITYHGIDFSYTIRLGINTYISGSSVIGGYITGYDIYRNDDLSGTSIHLAIRGQLLIQ